MWAATAVFALCTLISVVHADLALWGLLLILGVRVADLANLRRPARRSSPSAETGAEAT